MYIHLIEHTFLVNISILHAHLLLLSILIVIIYLVHNAQSEYIPFLIQINIYRVKFVRAAKWEVNTAKFHVNLAFYVIE